ncbi:hypothetical protein PY365_32715 [Roseiarcaceae bacterium H3SJ34-1]|uniref:tyrosine-type recombinase/integrase n=1 Tax=Terripilifer ovatus TaxID=3032367 RepID=UPI003AB91D4C|nr:hypothetical protein [Roseiarcaceae bacterium H3SJ34-1]
MSLPKGVSSVRSKGKAYWYHQDRRGRPDAGPRTALGEYGTPEFWDTLAKVTGAGPANPAPRANTFSHLIKHYKANCPKWGAYRENTRRCYETAFAHIEEVMGGLDPAAITIYDLLVFQSAFKAAETPTMGNIALSLVRSLMQWAIKQGLRMDNPARDVEQLDTNPAGARPLSEAAWRAITSPDAPEALRRYAVLARAIGQRISDVLPMAPGQRDEEGIQLTITKLRDQEHWCPLRPEEAEEIDSWVIEPCGKYITDGLGMPYAQSAFRRLWRQYEETEAGAALRGFTPHDLRATKVCDERIRGRPHQRIAAMVGMSLAMVMKYSKHIDQRLAARGAPLGQGWDASQKGKIE